MGFSKINIPLCNSFQDNFSSLLNPGYAALGDVNSRISSLTSGLSGITYTDPYLLNDMLYEYQNKVDGYLPGSTINDLYDLNQFLQECLYFSGLSPVTAMLGTLTGINRQIDDLTGNYSNYYPEFDYGNQAYGLDNYIRSLGLGNNLGSADKLLECLALGCAAFDSSYSSSYNSMSNELETMYNDLYMISDPIDPRYGMTDFKSIYSNEGLTSAQIESLENTRQGIEAAKNKATESVDQAVAAIKEEMKNGDIFA